MWIGCLHPRTNVSYSTQNRQKCKGKNPKRLTPRGVVLCNVNIVSISKEEEKRHDSMRYCTRHVIRHTAEQSRKAFPAHPSLEQKQRARLVRLRAVKVGRRCSLRRRLGEQGLVLLLAVMAEDWLCQSRLLFWLRRASLNAPAALTCHCQEALYQRGICARLPTAASSSATGHGIRSTVNKFAVVLLW